MKPKSANKTMNVVEPMKIKSGAIKLHKPSRYGTITSGRPTGAMSQSLMNVPICDEQREC